MLFIIYIFTHFYSILYFKVECFALSIAFVCFTNVLCFILWWYFLYLFFVCIMFLFHFYILVGKGQFPTLMEVCVYI